MAKAVSKIGVSQLNLPGLNLKSIKASHGGELVKGKRKEARPFRSKQAMHVILRSTKARGAHSLLHPNHAGLIKQLIFKLKNRWGVSVYHYANVGNHLHLLVRCRSKRSWQGFIRALAGQIAMIVTGSRKGQGLTRSARNLERGFWDHLVFTRLVTFGRDFNYVAKYLSQNIWEATGLMVQGLSYFDG